MRFSIIIPVYNRPEELEELLQSLVLQKPFKNPEIIVVEDGSSKTSSSVVKKFDETLNIKYCFKKNSGPGDSRNYGMERASGDYFILLDSDCILPNDYLAIVASSLEKNFTDAFGGPDAAHESFSSWQKAINYSMTSFLTTGGLRNKETASKKFQLRSFNMGMSKKAFRLIDGFSKQRIGEDIDLNFKLLKKDCTTHLIPEAFVFHKRRASWLSFFKQTNNFGAARPILNKIHPGSFKLTYWFPSLFLIGFVASFLLLYLNIISAALVFLIYTLAVLLDSFSKTKSLAVAFNSILAVYVQFFGYGSGYLRSFFRLYIRRMDIKAAFPGMFA
ncbi:MAG: glycosyltransferase [Flavobacteriales bacterium]|nr:glycosyltransferase [Flavobacteriales bacterium]